MWSLGGLGGLEFRVFNRHYREFISVILGGFWAFFAGSGRVLLFTFKRVFAFLVACFLPSRTGLILQIINLFSCRILK